MCDHHNFSAIVNVQRFEDTKQFMAEITVKCVDCGRPFQFMGLDPGLDTQGAKVSVDGLEARIAIFPDGARPSPLQRMAFNVNKFDG